MRIAAPLRSTDSAEITVVLRCDRYFVPALAGESQDTRILSARLLSLQAAR